MKKTSFGFTQLTNPTPNRAKLTFKLIVLLTTVAVFVISQTTLMSDHVKLEVTLWLKGVDMLALGISQMFGIEYAKPQIHAD